MKEKRKLSIVNYQLSIDEASTVARQVPWINEDEKIIVNSQLSIVNWIGLVLVSVKRRNEVERPERRCLSAASLRRAQRNEVTE